MILILHNITMSSLTIPEKYEKYLRVSCSVNGYSKTTPPSGREWQTPKKANVGGDGMNPGIEIIPIPSSKGLLGG